MSAQADLKDETNVESLEFSAEISKVLQLMIHSLYTNKDIFLRELISNASDACDKLRYEAVQNGSLYGDDTELKVTLSYDEKAKTITVADNGIGMNRDDLVANLGTIAKSGTQEFFSQLTGDEKKDLSLIGQFGVGFYSSFMVAEHVTVHTRKAGDEQAWRWESDGTGTFTIEEAEDKARGTAITLKLKKDAKEYLDKFKLKFITQTYSDHVSFPIEIVDEEGNVERVNEGSAIWMRPKSDITEEQYNEFYSHVSHSPDTPWLRLHGKAEGTIEYSYLLYVPSMKPFDLYHPERRRRVKLYVKRVFITDEGVDLVPQYLRFMRGVIDSEDLPLNISRETLQDNPMLRKIREAITKKALSEFAKKAKKDEEGYADFWENFGPVLKEGLCESDAPKDKILDVCRFHSTESEKLTSLADYAERMKEGQEAIYFLTGDDVDVLKRSPQLEGFKKQGIEVLLLTDHVDDFWVGVNAKYKELPFRSVIRSGEDLDKLEGAEGEDASSDDKKETKAKKEDQQDLSKLTTALQAVYGDEVREVRTTSKLSESPVCLAIGEGDMDIRMERFLLEHKQLPRGAAKILEINPDHAIIQALSKRLGEADTADEDVADIAWLLLDQARIQEGEPVADPFAFSQRLCSAINKLLSQ